MSSLLPARNPVQICHASQAPEYSTLFQGRSPVFACGQVRVSNSTIAMAKPENIVLHSAIPPDECLRRIEASTDPGNRTLFSLSGYKGSKPLLVKFDGNQFKLWKRRYYRNDFAPYFFGTFRPIIRALASRDISAWTAG